MSRRQFKQLKFSIVLNAILIAGFAQTAWWYHLWAKEPSRFEGPDYNYLTVLGFACAFIWTVLLWMRHEVWMAGPDNWILSEDKTYYHPAKNPTFKFPIEAYIREYGRDQHHSNLEEADHRATKILSWLAAKGLG